MARSAATTLETSTADRVLDVAERLVQTRGFNGISYADVAAEIGTTKAALHYHFPSKADLGKALIDRYTVRFREALQDIDTSIDDAFGKLDAYASLYLDVLRADRMCLCGMLAAEYETLSAPMRDAVVAFFDLNERWLEQVLRDGKRAGTLHPRGSLRTAARVLISGLEGAMLVARVHHDPARLRIAKQQLLAELR